MSHPSIQDVQAAVASVLLGNGRAPMNARRNGEVFPERLLSLRHAEALPWGTRAVRIVPGTVVTPMARDFLKRQGIGVLVVAKSESANGHESGEWGFVI